MRSLIRLVFLPLTLVGCPLPQEGTDPAERTLGFMGFDPMDGLILGPEHHDTWEPGMALPANSFTVIPAGAQHFAWVEEPTVIQLTTYGPWETNYVDDAQDPRF